MRLRSPLNNVGSRMMGSRDILKRVIEFDMCVAKKAAHGRTGRAGTLRCGLERVFDLVI